MNNYSIGESRNIAPLKGILERLISLESNFHNQDKWCGEISQKVNGLQDRYTSMKDRQAQLQRQIDQIAGIVDPPLVPLKAEVAVPMSMLRPYLEYWEECQKDACAEISALKEQVSCLLEELAEGKPAEEQLKLGNKDAIFLPKCSELATSVTAITTALTDMEGENVCLSRKVAELEDLNAALVRKIADLELRNANQVKIITKQQQDNAALRYEIENLTFKDGR